MSELLPSAYARQLFVWADPQQWPSILEANPVLRAHELTDRWGLRNWPLIVRRRCSYEAASGVPLGLPLPRGCGGLRMALRVPPASIRLARRAPLLTATCAIVPALWLPTVTRLIALDPEVRVFGSLAWQHHTGLTYLHGDSDLDLLWSLPDGGRAEVLTQQIAAIARQAPMQIDGEMLNARGGAVQWRELLESNGELLVKTAVDVRLMSRSAFLSVTGP